MTTMTSREFNQDTGRAKREAEAAPVIITDRGRPSHVLMSYLDFQRLQEGRRTLLDFMDHPPSAAIDIEFDLPNRNDMGFRIPDFGDGRG